MKSLCETFEVVVAPGQWVTLVVMWTGGQESQVDEVINQFRSAGYVPVPGHFMPKLQEQFRQEIARRTLAHYTYGFGCEVVVDPINGASLESGQSKKIRADGFVAMQKST